MIAPIVPSPSSASVETRDAVVLAFVAVLVAALVVTAVASVWLVVRRKSSRDVSDVKSIEMINTPADAWACMGTLESMLPPAIACAGPVELCADGVEGVVVECDVATSRVNDPARAHVVSCMSENEQCDDVEEHDITSAHVSAVEATAPNQTSEESERLSWVEDAAVAPMWASLRRDESAKDESGKTQAFFKTLVARR